MYITPKSGAGLHKILLRSVMRAPQKFFDETDSGITLNRFSQDMTLIDGSIPNNAIMSLSGIFETPHLYFQLILVASLGCLTQLALIAIGSTYMALTVPLLLFCVYFLQKYYLRTSRQIRFLDLECKSPLYTHFTETLEGLSTIRAFGWQDQFMKENLKRLDTSQKPYYLLYCIQRWLNLVLLVLVGIMAVAVMALATSLTGTTSAGRLGISLSSVVTFNGILSYLLTFWTMLETSMGAIARLKAFEEGTASENKEQEHFIPSNEWPEHGAIEFLDVSASYG
jgi:ATP-binding cassette subfamily C (CFTR/MRP) protein 1